MRRIARLIVLSLFVLSLAGTAVSLARIASDPTLRALRTAASQEILAATDRMMAQASTPAHLTALIETRLAEDPRNWIALDALTQVAIEQATDLAPELTARVEVQRATDFGLLAQTASCAICAYNAAACSLSQVFICQAPVALTTLGDMIGVTRAGTAYALGEEVDQIDLALSVVGLGATATVLVSGGTSAGVRAGAALAKTARAMGRLAPELVDIARLAVRNGVDWAELPAVRSLDDLRSAIRADAFAQLSDLLTDLERLRAATDSTTALHLLPLVGSAGNARQLAGAAEALGPKLIGAAEVLGKARLLRTTARLTNIGWSVFSALSGLGLSLVMMAASFGQRLSLRALRDV
jgi:hypothetical protein